MKPFLLALRQFPDRRDAAIAAIEQAGFGTPEIVYGWHGNTLRLRPELAMWDRPHDSEPQRCGKVGLYLSWLKMFERLSSEPEAVAVFEDDVRFVDDFRERMCAALDTIPGEWDVVHLGHCCTDDKPTEAVSDSVAIIRYPICSHAILMQPRAIELANDVLARFPVSTHMDITLARCVWPLLRHYTLVPALAYQSQEASLTTARTWRDVQGWFDYARIYDEAIGKAVKRDRESVFIEVGCWRGRSAAYMAEQIARRRARARLWCVDPWTGTEGHPHQEDVQKAGGSIFPEFAANLRATGGLPFVSTMIARSTEAAKTFRDGSVDFVWIDGDHSAEAVEADVRAWLPKLAAGGMMAGHDWDRQTVKDGVVKSGIKFRTWERCWIML